MTSQPDIALAYVAVHEIFQLALAAEEMGRLEALRCSLVDRPGKWGQKLSTRLPIPSARPLGYNKIPPGKMVEFPWPLLLHRLVQKLLPSRATEHLLSNSWFDRSAARWLRKSKARIFVGTETCALHSFQVAKKRGMTAVLDCAGIPHQFLERVTREASAESGLPSASTSTFSSARMMARKQQELLLADVILCCSEFQAARLIDTGVNASKVETIPLWVDSDYWGREAPSEVIPAKGPLKVVYAGSVSLKKGVPYLLQAMHELGQDAELTLVGKVSRELDGISQHLPANCRHIDYVQRDELRKIYASNDVLVMPSLGDSFGFVTMEAMAAGLPVVVSENTGAPLPCADWRVPARDAPALATRLRRYAHNRETLLEDSKTAKSFARKWTPEAYRKGVQAVFSRLLK